MTSDRQSSGSVSAQTATRVITKFWVEYRGHKIELRPGVTLIGRSAACQIVLDDGLVARRHAQFRVEQTQAVLEDFGSVNGVFVNGERIVHEREVRDGDVIKMGKQEMVLRSVSINMVEAAVKFGAETLHGDVTLNKTRDIGDTAERAGLGPTNREAFAVLGSVADKVLALGRGAEAERMLSGTLQSLLKASTKGGVPSELADKAAAYAVRLVAATKKASWADYVFELFRNLRRPLPGPVVDQLYSVLRSVSGVDLTLLRNYVALLQALQHSFGPTERFLVQRIEGLERIVML